MAGNLSQGQVLYEFESYRLDPVQRVLKRGDEFVPLAPKAFDVLLTLVESAGRPVDKKDLLDRVWPDTFVEEGSLTQSISILRKVLEQGGGGIQYIETISKRGYRFSAPVKVLESVPGDAEFPVSNGSRTDSASGGNGPGAKANWERRLWLTVVAALAVLALAEPYLLKSPKVEIGPIRFVLSPPEGTRIHPASAVSPDGSKVAFVAIDRSGSRALWVRPVASEAMHRLDDTEGALLPFWSPDSEQIGFFADGKIKILPVAGGSARIVCEQRYPGGGTWNRDGVILFSQSGRLYRVSAAGGAPVPVMELDIGRGEMAHTFPQFLPDGRRFLFFTEISGGVGRGARSGTYLASLDSSDRRLLMASRYRAAFAPPDHLLFVQNGSLVAQKVDLKRGLVTGEPAHVANQVTVRLDRFFVNPQPGLAIDGGGAAFSVSDNGVLLYHSGSPPKSQLVWYDRDGTRLGTAGEPREYAQVRLAPDDRHAAVAIKNTEKDDWENWSLWLLDTETNLFSRLTWGDGRDADPVWSPDSSQVVYSAFSKSVRRVDMMAITVGQNSPVVFYRDEHSNKPDAWSPDGRFILCRRDERVVLTLTTGAERRPAILFDRPYVMGGFRFSPDSRHLAYSFDESNVPGHKDTSTGFVMGEIFITSFPDLTAMRRISTSGGCSPQWRRDGQELFYLGQHATVMAVDMPKRPHSEPGTPRKLFQPAMDDSGRAFPGFCMAQYAVTGDGKRFLVLEPVVNASEQQAHIVTPWTSELRMSNGQKPN